MLALLVLVAPVVVLAVVGVLVLLVAGVVYPAVWSRDADRRAAALAVLRVLLSRRRKP